MLYEKIIFLAALLVCSIATQAQRFALVDMEYILKQIPAYEQANQQMENLSKQWQSEIETKAQEAKTLYDEYQKMLLLYRLLKRQNEKTLSSQRKRSSRLTKKYFGPEGEGMKKRQELIGPIQDAIYNAIKDIATQKNYDAVIDRASAQSMIFASPRIDISNEVLSKLGYSN